MLDLLNNCVLKRLNSPRDLFAFDCRIKDLNDFFRNDAFNYQKQLLGKTYYFLSKEELKVVTAFTISNDALKLHALPNNRRKTVNKKIPGLKRFNSYPAILIGRLGVHKTFQKAGIGSDVLNFIKAWFVDIRNKTGCRFILVDSYNNPETIEFYKNNGFTTLYSSEDQEMNALKSKILKTRIMFFDLITFNGIS